MFAFGQLLENRPLTVCPCTVDDAVVSDDVSEGVSSRKGKSTELPDHVADWEKEEVPPTQTGVADVSPKLDHLAVDEKAELNRVLTRFPDVFSQQGEIGRFRGEQNCEFKVELSGEPKKSKRYSVPVALRSELQKQIDSMLEQDIIRPCSSPHASPVLLVPKKVEPGEPPKYRWFVTDFRELKKVTVGDRHRLPRIESMLSELGPKAKFFSVLDRKGAYWQLPVKEADQKLSFV